MLDLRAPLSFNWETPAVAGRGPVHRKNTLVLQYCYRNAPVMIAVKNVITDQKTECAMVRSNTFDMTITAPEIIAATALQLPAGAAGLDHRWLVSANHRVRPGNGSLCLRETD